MSYLAVDIGATKTLLALFSDNGRVLRRFKFPTNDNFPTFFKNLSTNLKPFTSFKIKAIAVAIPGLVYNNYSVEFGNRNWGKIDLFTPIKKLFNCPIILDNDASLASLYEGSDLPGLVIFLTFSTGLGGGVIKNNQLLPASSTFEPGHRFYTFNGQTEEWEDIASASAIGKAYQVKHATSLRGKTIMQDIATRISLGLPDIIQEFNPDIIIFGGPLGKIFNLYSPYLPSIPNVQFKRPRRPSDSVIYGCYLLAKTQA